MRGKKEEKNLKQIKPNNKKLNVITEELVKKGDI